MLTSAQEFAIACLLTALWLGVGGLMVMQWRIRDSIGSPFTLRPSPSQTQEIIRAHRQMFPHSIFRKLVGYGSLLAGLMAVVAALLSSRSS
jgi:hypothetical protein